MALQNLLIQLSNHSIEHELPLPHDIHLDGVVHRYCAQPQQYKRDKDEWYIAHELGSHLVCTYGTWKNGGQHYTYRSWKDSDISPEELKRLKEELAEHQKQVQREEAEAHKAAAERAHDIWSQSTPCESHGYLEKKGVKAHFAREYQGMLVIPIYDAETDELQSLQFIGDDSTKRFLKGGRTQNGYAILGSWQKDVSIAEGFATAATVHEITSRTVIIAFSANNLARVALHIKKRQKAHTTALLQDLGDAGEKAAEQWQQHQLGDVFKPSWGKDEPKSDWNDLAQDKGVEEVARQLAPRRFPSYSLEDFLEQDSAEETWAVKNLFTDGSINVIHASGGVGKSLLATDLALGCSAGFTVMNDWECRKQKVLVIDGELTPVTLRSRWMMAIQRWGVCGHNDIGDIQMLPWLQVQQETSQDLNLYCPVSRAYLDPLIEESEFIVLDNFDSLTLRSGDEDFRGDEMNWALVFRWLRSWAAKGKTFLIVMHSTKGGSLAGTRRITGDAYTVLRLDPLMDELRHNRDNVAFLVQFSKGRSVEEKFKKPFAVEMLTMEEAKHGYARPWRMHDLQTLSLQAEATKKEAKAMKTENFIKQLY